MCPKVRANRIASRRIIVERQSLQAIAVLARTGSIQGERPISEPRARSIAPTCNRTTTSKAEIRARLVHRNRRLARSIVFRAKKTMARKSRHWLVVDVLAEPMDCTNQMACSPNIAHQAIRIKSQYLSLNPPVRLVMMDSSKRCTGKPDCPVPFRLLLAILGTFD